MPDQIVERWESIVDRSALRASDRIKRVLRDRYYRPIKSEKVPKDVQLQEYLLLRENPSMLAQFLKDQKASPKSAIDYIDEMEKMANGQAEPQEMPTTPEMGY